MKLSLSRRRFLQTTALTAAGMAMPRLLRANGSGLPKTRATYNSLQPDMWWIRLTVEQTRPSSGISIERVLFELDEYQVDAYVRVFVAEYSNFKRLEDTLAEEVKLNFFSANPVFRMPKPLYQKQIPAEFLPGSPLYLRLSDWDRERSCYRSAETAKIFAPPAHLEWRRYYIDTAETEDSGYSNPLADDEFEDCFLTTACVRHRGLPDNCAELEGLRAFRDGFLLQSDEGRELVKAYYAMAPKIVRRLDRHQEADALYGWVHRDLVGRSLELVGQGRGHEAAMHYAAFTRQLAGVL